MTDRRINKSYLDFAGSMPGTRLVDDETSADLELDEVFRGIDRSLTSPGQSMLYALLRSTPSDEEVLEHRMRRIRFYADRRDLREGLRRLLKKKVGFQLVDDVARELFVVSDSGLAKHKNLISLWIAITIASCATPVFLGIGALFLIVLPIAILNIVIYGKSTGQISVHAASLYYIGVMASFCGRMRKLPGHEESEELARLAALYPKIKRVIRPAAFLRPVTSLGSDMSDAALLFIKVFFLGEIANYIKAVEAIRDSGAELRALYETVGLIDAFCSLAMLAEEEDAPTAARATKGFGKIAAAAAFHPLVEGCVPVSFSFDRGVILTGTNMSGKSTFLRILGINQILAANLGMAYAESFETDLYFVTSSIRSEDDRAAGKSRYLAEAERLLEITRAIKAADPPLLALIDEILNGTNSQDRIAASIAILKGAAGRGSILVAATHDLGIATALEGDYEPLFFSERIEDGRLIFDYELRKGIADRKNARRLLRIIGFGDDILGPDDPPSRELND
jgi:hypothetical protein